MAEKKLTQGLVNLAERGEELAALRSKINKEPSIIDSTSSNGSTLLHYAAEKGRTETFFMLFMEGSNIETTNDSKKTPLDFVKENLKTLQEIEKLTAPPAGGVPVLSRRAIHLAKYTYDHEPHLEEMLDILKEHPELVHSTDDEGNTLLHHAAKNGNLEMYKLLIKGDAYKFPRNCKNETPFELAKRHREDVEEVIEKIGFWNNDV